MGRAYQIQAKLFYIKNVQMTDKGRI